jgi:hypothetical protein
MEPNPEFEVFKADLQKGIETHKAQLQRDLESFKATVLSQQDSWKEQSTINIRKWEHDLEWLQSSFRALIDFSVVAIRSLILINGGAVVAILAFLSNVWKADGQAGGLSIAKAITGPLAYFIGGLVAAIATSMFAYLAQMLFTERRKEKEGQMQSPLGSTCRVIAMVLAIASLVAFACGSWRAVQVFATAPM